MDTLEPTAGTATTRLAPRHRWGGGGKCLYLVRKCLYLFLGRYVLLECGRRRCCFLGDATHLLLERGLAGSGASLGRSEVRPSSVSHIHMGKKRRGNHREWII